LLFRTQVNSLVVLLIGLFLQYIYLSQSLRASATVLGASTLLLPNQGLQFTSGSPISFICLFLKNIPSYH